MSLLHIRVGKRLKQRMRFLIEIGLFSNQAEIAREALRGLLLKYNKELSDRNRVSVESKDRRFLGKNEKKKQKVHIK